MKWGKSAERWLVRREELVVNDGQGLVMHQGGCSLPGDLLQNC